MQLITAVFLALVYSTAPGAKAKLIDDVKDLPRQQFDFIIVGGGTAGNVVANRLSENPAYQVLVLEAGPSNDNVLDIQVPGLAVQVTPNTPWDYNYTTVAQTGLDNRVIAYPRGHVLGGCSSANYMMYTRASSEDFDRYAAVSGDSGWSWKNILPYYTKLEKWTAPADHHNTAGQYDPLIHTSKGLLATSLDGFPTPVDNQVIDTIHRLGGIFKFNLDYNSGSQLGMGFLQSTINNVDRASSATAYLGPQFINRPNLYVLVNARVSRVVQSDKGATPGFRAVEFRQNDGAGPLNSLTAKKEIILSAGSVGTPHILLNSGIGNAKALQAVGVKSLVNLPDVGENMSDHPVLGNAWLVNSTQTFETPLRDPDVMARDLSLWRNKTGPFVDTIASHIGFMRLPPTVKTLSPDTPSGPNSPHYEIFVSNGIPVRNVPPTGNFIGIATVVVSPASRGSIKIRSNNPFDAPIIDPGLLTNEYDRVIMRQAVKSAKLFMSAPAWNGYTIGPSPALANTTTDAEIDAYVAANAGTIFHPVGTSSMSPKGSSSGVVDPDLRVKKVLGLRVVDASVMPFIPSAHTQGPTYAIAERASDLIKALYH